MTSCSNPSYPFTCGDMFCAKDSETCGLYMTEIAMESLRVGLSQGLGGDICATMNIKGCDGTVFTYVGNGEEGYNYDDWGDFRSV